MVQKCSSAANTARHPTPWCSALWIPRGYLWHVPKNFMGENISHFAPPPQALMGHSGSRAMLDCTKTRFGMKVQMNVL